MEETHEVTALLQDWSGGEGEAFDRLLPLIYDELRRVARGQLRWEPSGITLSATALVHEAYFKLVAQTRVDWQNRAHFYAVAVRIMRRILVDRARRRRAQKRGGRQVPLQLVADEVGADEQAALILAVDQALDRLKACDERLTRVVECRYFAGLTHAETAEVLQVSERTVRRDWTKAQAWLYRELYLA